MHFPHGRRSGFPRCPCGPVRCKRRSLLPFRAFQYMSCARVTRDVSLTMNFSRKSHRSLSAYLSLKNVDICYQVMYPLWDVREVSRGFMKVWTIKIFSFVLIFALIIGMVFVISRLSGETDPRDTNFSFFWLAGKMILNGENPYDEAQYLAGHDLYQINWEPNKIFPYPLPLAIFCIPLGFLSLDQAYLLWRIITLCIVAMTVFILINQWERAAQRRLFLPLFIAMFFFGPVYLTLRTGSIGAFPLLIILFACLLLKNEKSFYAGILLSLTILKPPQGLTILLLAGIWFLARRDWKAIYGIGAGGLALLIIGLIQDPLWLMKFREASAAVMDRTQGIHSNVWALSYLACKGASVCSTMLGAVSSASILGLSGFLLWKRQAQATVWEAMSFIIPMGFITTVYLWEYDQILYVIPIIWVVGTLVQKTKSYVHAFLFLIVLIFYAFFAVAKLRVTFHDLWSWGNTLILLAGYWLALSLKEKPEKNKIAQA